MKPCWQAPVGARSSLIGQHKAIVQTWKYPTARESKVTAINDQSLAGDIDGVVWHAVRVEVWVICKPWPLIPISLQVGANNDDLADLEPPKQDM
jgi:hypothetical protein